MKQNMVGINKSHKLKKHKAKLSKENPLTAVRQKNQTLQRTKTKKLKPI